MILYRHPSAVTPKVLPGGIQGSSQFRLDGRSSNAARFRLALHLAGMTPHGPRGIATRYNA